MRVTVYGLWHLGSVTAACLADGGHTVVGLDPDPATVATLSANKPPVDEPGLAALLAEQQQAGRLRFSADAADAVPDAEVVWVCFDTPVDASDSADVQWVRDRLDDIAPHLKAGTRVLISSQVPVGFGAKLAAETSVILREAMAQIAPANTDAVAGTGAEAAATDPAAVAEGERRYAQRYREPRANPDRAVVEIAVERVLGRA